LKYNGGEEKLVFDNGEGLYKLAHTEEKSILPLKELIFKNFTMKKLISKTKNHHE